MGIDISNVNLNSNEAAILDAAWDAESCNGHDFGFADEIEMPNGIARKSLSGYMSQLSQKGLVDCYPDEPGEPKGMFKVTELGAEFVVTKTTGRPLYGAEEFIEDDEPEQQPASQIEYLVDAEVLSQRISEMIVAGGLQHTEANREALRSVLLNDHLTRLRG